MILLLALIFFLLLVLFRRTLSSWILFFFVSKMLGFFTKMSQKPQPTKSNKRSEPKMQDLGEYIDYEEIE